MHDLLDIYVKHKKNSDLKTVFLMIKDTDKSFYIFPVSSLNGVMI